jgi:hypothetical protein
MTLIALDFTTPDDSFPLVHLEIIDWDQIEPIDTPMFHDDEAIVKFLCSSNSETCSTNESHNQFLIKSAKFLSYKINNIKDLSTSAN